MHGISSHPSPWVTRRLWKWGGLIALLFLITIIANHILPKDKAFGSSMFGQDFLPTYTAGQFIREGKLHQIYDPIALSAAEQSTEASAGIEVKHVYGAWLNPPFAALPAVWLARFPYWQALKIWSLCMSAMTVTAAILLIQLLPPPRRWQEWALIPVLLFAAMPLWQATMHAQNTPFAFAVLTAAVVLWRNEQIVTAGMMAGLLAYKPQLGAVFAIVFITIEGRRALLGLAMTGTALLAINCAALPGTLSDYFHQLPSSLQIIQSTPDYTWHRHVTWLGFWRLLLQGHVAGLPTLTTTIIADLFTTISAAALGWVVWKNRSAKRSRDRLIAAAIVSMPLIMQYYVDYDLTLLAIPAVLCVADFKATGVDRRIVNAWTFLYLLLEISTGIAGSTRILAAVPILAYVSALMIRRALQPVQSNIETPIIPQPLPLAA